MERKIILYDENGNPREMNLFMSPEEYKRWGEKFYNLVKNDIGKNKIARAKSEHESRFHRVD